MLGLKPRKKMYSYIKKPFSADGWFGFFIALAAFLLTQALIVMAVIRPESIGIPAAAAGICAVMFALSAVVFAFAAIYDRSSNHIFAVIAMVLSIAVIAEWALVLSVFP